MAVNPHPHPLGFSVRWLPVTVEDPCLPVAIWLQRGSEDGYSLLGLGFLSLTLNGTTWVRFPSHYSLSRNALY